MSDFSSFSLKAVLLGNRFKKRKKIREREREKRRKKKEKKNKEGIPRSISLARKSHITPKKTKKQK